MPVGGSLRMAGTHFTCKMPALTAAGERMASDGSTSNPKGTTANKLADARLECAS